MDALVILQARTSSRRLPNKALLPIANYPSAVLAAIRAANRRHRTLLATSDDSSDDFLTETALKHGVEVFRGPLNDVLARFFFAAAALSNDSIVVRLTGDNVVPDGALVTEIIDEFQRSGCEYLDTDPALSKLPHGVGGEAFTVAALRKAHTMAVSPEDREHVGLWMKRHCRSGIFSPRLERSENFAHLRCTIDDEDDYQTVSRLFAHVSDPRAVGWLELARKLASLPSTATCQSPGRRVSGMLRGGMVLGTAQLGMKYGRVNQAGKPTKENAVEMLRHAIARGVTTLDTARSYGDAECVIGEALAGNARSQTQVITKLDLSGLNEWASELEVRNRVDAGIEASRRVLRAEKLDGLLLHNWAHHHMWRGAVWERLRFHQISGRVSLIGASVYYPHEALAALADPAIRMLQIPMNVLDLRWEKVAHAAADRPDVAVYARSALLQGILAHPAGWWPQVGHFDNADCVFKLQELAKEFERVNVTDLCFAYVRSLPWITGVIVGCETLDQLRQNLQMFLRPELSGEQMRKLRSTLPNAPEELLNPAQWPAPEHKTAHAS